MLFKCAHHGPETGSSSIVNHVQNINSKIKSVDIHCHLHVPAVDAMVKDAFDLKYEPLMWHASEETRAFQRQHTQDIMPMATDVGIRLSHMDAAGVDIQAVSTGPGHYCYWAEPELGRDVAQTVNNSLAELVASNPDRFVGLGTVPLQNPEMAVVELNRCVNDLGMRGVEISTDVCGTELSRAGLDKFFARVEELGVVIFMHPGGFTESARFADHYFSNIIANPLASTVAVHYLIFDGVMDRHPGLKICVAHGGGFMASYSGRIDHAHPLRPDMQRHLPKGKIPTDYLKRFYFDTVVFTDHQLEYLVKVFGADHIVMGTDYPYDMAETDPVGHVNGADLTDDQKAVIIGGNAANLLGLN